MPISLSLTLSPLPAFASQTFFSKHLRNSEMKNIQKKPTYSILLLTPLFLSRPTGWLLQHTESSAPPSPSVWICARVAAPKHFPMPLARDTRPVGGGGRRLLFLALFSQAHLSFGLPPLASIISFLQAHLFLSFSHFYSAPRVEGVSQGLPNINLVIPCVLELGLISVTHTSCHCLPWPLVFLELGTSFHRRPKIKSFYCVWCFHSLWCTGASIYSSSHCS